MSKIAGGDLRALASFGNVVDLPDQVVSELINHIVGKLEAQLNEARKGAYGLGGDDLASALVILNAWHPNVAQWAPVEAQLAEPRSHTDHIAGAIVFIGRLRDQISEPTREGLKPLLEQLVLRPPQESILPLFHSRTDVSSVSAVALAKCFPDEVTDLSLRRLLAGKSSSREAALEILALRGMASDLNLVSLLASDADPDVRAAAAQALAKMYADGEAYDDAKEVLAELLAAPGCEVGERVSRQLSGTLSIDVRDVLTALLESHPSALVRLRVAIARRNVDS